MTTHRHWPFVFIAIAVALAYAWSLSTPFVLDDDHAITGNPYLAARPIWRAIEAPPESPLSGRPVVALTFALNYAWGALHPFGYHAFNLAIHMANAFLVLAILRRTFALPAVARHLSDEGGMLAVAAAALWGTHPLLSDAVIYTTQRTELLMALFYLLTLWASIRAWDSPHPRRWQCAAVVACALGMMSKEVMVSAPLMVMLYDRAFRAASWRELFAHRKWFYVALALSWLVLWGVALGARTRSSGFDEGAGSFDYAFAQCAVIFQYLRLSVWPAPLCLDYGQFRAMPLPAVIAGAIVIAALAIGTVWAWRRAPALGFAGTWFFAILGPTSSFYPITSEVAAERRMYLALAAVVSVLAWLVVRAAYAMGPAWPRRAIGALCAVAVLFVPLVVVRSFDYASVERIWRDTMEKQPDNVRAFQNLGAILIRDGRLVEARPLVEEALRIDAGFYNAHVSMGDLLLAEGQLEAALPYYREGLRLVPDNAEALCNFAITLLRLGRASEAEEPARAAVHAKPYLALAHNTLGGVLLQLEQFDKARAAFERALALNPDYPEAHANLSRTLGRMGAALARSGKHAEAIPLFEAALAENPANADAGLNLGGSHLALGNARKAVEIFTECVRRHPEDVRAHVRTHLAWAELRLAEGNLDEAEHHVNEALLVAPDSAEAKAFHARIEASRSP